MPTPPAVTVPRFRAYLGKQSVDDDGMLAEMAVAATSIAERSPDCGVGAIVQRPVTALVRIRGGYGTLPMSPPVSITSPAGLTLDPDLALVYGPDGPTTVTYLVGRAATVEDVPEDLRLAVCIIGKHLWETQRGRPASRGGVLVGEEDRVPQGFLIPNRARAILQGYKPWVAIG